MAIGFIALWTPLLGAQPPTGRQAAAKQKPAAATQNEFRKGALYGKVVGPDGKPIQGATVALQDKGGKVLAWTNTNAEGEYALAADPMQALHLRPSKRRGLLEACARGVGDVAFAPVKAVGGAVANPGKTLQAGAASVAGGSPLPLAARAAAGMPDKNTGTATAKSARDLAAKTALGEGPNSASNKSVGDKGQAQLLVGAQGFKDAKVKAGAFWMDGPTTDKANPVGMQAWLETVRMAPTSGAAKSDIELQALTLAEPLVEPTLLPAGGDVKIQVKLKSPPGPDHLVRVFARESRTNTVVELLPKDGPDKSLFVGTVTLDPKTPPGETTLCVAALRAVPVEVKLDPKKPDPLLQFVKRLDDMQPARPYEYDPRIMASENRLDIKLTVLAAKKGA